MPLPQNPMSFKLKLTKDLPKDTILYVPDTIKCPDCGKHVPIQEHCIACGHKFLVEYLGNYIVHMSELISDEVRKYIRENE
jgi:DNA-directed RNA polymerase subunit RPC12/RpoP